MSRIRVLHFITGLNPGGAENMLKKTVGLLDPARYESIICSLVGGKLEPELRRKHDVVVLGAGSMLCFPRAVLRLHGMIRSEKIDVVHSYLFHANIVSRFAAIGTRAKVISSIRIKEVGKWSHNFVDAWTSFLVDKYTVVSESVRDFVVKQEKISPEKVVAIPNGLDLKQYDVSIDKDKKRQELGLSEDSHVLVSVANLRKSKDYPTLFRAFKEVVENVDAELLVVGKGEAEGEYRQIASDLGIAGKVHFLGFRNDVVELIALADVCILSTFYEGQSNALLEYMAMRKPIVATDIAENREVIDNEKEGLLVPPKSPDALSRAIQRLLDDGELREKLMYAAYERVKREHDIKTVVRRTTELYEELLR